MRRLLFAAAIAGLTIMAPQPGEACTKHFCQDCESGPGGPHCYYVNVSANCICDSIECTVFGVCVYQ